MYSKKLWSKQSHLFQKIINKKKNFLMSWSIRKSNYYETDTIVNPNFYIYTKIILLSLEVWGNDILPQTQGEK